MLVMSPERDPITVVWGGLAMDQSPRTKDTMGMAEGLVVMDPVKSTMGMEEGLLVVMAPARGILVMEGVIDAEGWNW